VVAALLQLDHRPTPVAALPALFLGLLQKLVCRFVERAVSRRVPLAAAGNTNLCIAPGAPSDFASGFSGDVLRFDRGATLPRRAIKSIFRRMFHEFMVPNVLKIRVE